MLGTITLSRWNFEPIITRALRASLVFAVLFGSIALIPGKSKAQQTLAFTVGDKNYRASITWLIKHNNTEFKSQTAHTFDRSLDPNFDLAVFFQFANDSLPPGNDIVWGFQFSQSGDILSPANNEKRSRSSSQFQRFDLTGSGTATLAIVPKAWKKTGPDKYEMIGLGKLITLSFAVSDKSQPLQTGTANGPDSARTPNPAGESGSPGRLPKPIPPLAELPEEKIAYVEAQNVPDTMQKIKAMMDFVDKYAAVKPNSELVAKAIENVPLGISVPENKGDGTYTYTLNYTTRPVVDTVQVRGWDWKLSEKNFGKYELVLTDLRDSIHIFKIADPGKKAPFNEPKSISPFEKITIRLVNQTKDSFQIYAEGGVPPFIIFLSQNGFPRERYVMAQTNTIRSFSKAACVRCETGKYTLEVYSSDFSTLLMQADQAIQIRKINYLLLILFAIVGIPIAYFGIRWFRRYWQVFQYERKLKQIQAWELKEEQDAAKRKET